MNSNSSVTSNLTWKFLEQVSAQIIATIVSILLARVLEPTHYGVISVVMVFITFANIFVSNGFGSALIQKKNAKAIDFFSVLYFNLAFSCFLYAILFIAAPYIAQFYGEGYEILTPVLRVLGLRIIFSAVNSVQQAYVSKKMMFKKFFISTLSGTIFSAAVGIGMAYSGCGVWSLVAQNLVSTSVNTIVLTIIIKQKPRFIFSFASLKELFPFGAQILGTGLLISGYQEIQALAVGKIYTSETLAYYDRGKSWPALIVTNINTSISSVLFPKMANEQDDRKRIKEMTRLSIQISSYIMSPMMLGLAAVASPLVLVLLTDKWSECIPLLQMFCIIYLFQPINTANMQAIKAIGKSGIYLGLEIIKKIIELILFLIVMRVSVEAIVISTLICTVCFTFMNMIPNTKLLQYRFKEQISDLFPNLGLSLIMFMIVYAIQFLPINDLVTLIIQVFVGIAIYLLLSILVRKKEFIYLKNMLFNKLRRKKEQ